MLQKKNVYSFRKIGKRLLLCMIAIVSVGGSHVLADSYAEVNDEVSDFIVKDTYVAKKGTSVSDLSTRLNVKVSKLKEFQRFENQDILKDDVQVSWWTDTNHNDYLKIDGMTKKIEIHDRLDLNFPLGVSLSFKTEMLPFSTISELILKNELSNVAGDLDSKESFYLEKLIDEQNKLPEKQNGIENDTVISRDEMINQESKDANFPIVIVEKPADKVENESMKEIDNVEQNQDLENENDIIDVKISNQQDLDTYLARTGLDLSGDRVYFDNREPLKFKRGDYYLTKSLNWYFGSDSVGNIDLNDSKFFIGNDVRFGWELTGNHENQVIANASFYGSVREDVAEDGSVIRPANWENGNFNADLIHTENMAFRNLSYYNAQQMNDHIFDVMGSSNIVFDGLTFAGYGGKTYSDVDLVKLYKKNKHSIQAEAIQIDASNYGASGNLDLSNSVLWDNSMNDGKASTNIEIKDSVFTNYVGKSGQALIDDSDEIVVRNVGASLGGHSKGSSTYEHISIHDNTFENTIFVPDVSDASINPIHINVTGDSDTSSIEVYDNTFVNQNTSSTNNGEVVSVGNDQYLSWYE